MCEVWCFDSISMKQQLTFHHIQISRTSDLRFAPFFRLTAKQVFMRINCTSLFFVEIFDTMFCLICICLVLKLVACYFKSVSSLGQGHSPNRWHKRLCEHNFKTVNQKRNHKSFFWLSSFGSSRNWFS